MAFPRFANPIDTCSSKFLIKSVIVAIICLVAIYCAHAQDSQPKGTNDSWTATARTSLANTSPTRTTESHVRSGNQSIDRQIVEALGPNGRYQPSIETEKETVQVNATTTRTDLRTYSWDVNGQRNLEQVTEEEARSSASGDRQIIRTSSQSDGNGNLQVAQREVADTRRISPDVQETKTTTYLPNGNGDLAPSLQTRELQKRCADGTVEVKQTLLQPDPSGNWQVAEVKESTVKEDNKNRTTEERISRPDSGGGLSQVSRIVGKETENAAGEKSTTVETYFQNAPGVEQQPSSSASSPIRTTRTATCKSRQEPNMSCGMLPPVRTTPRPFKSATSTAHSMWFPSRRENQTRRPCRYSRHPQKNLNRFKRAI
jgi:hypothetical protein